MLERLKRRADFLRIARGHRVHARTLSLQASPREGISPSEVPLPRVGFTLTRKIGNAVERNRIRRRWREVVRLSGAGLLQPGMDYVILPRRVCLEASFSELVKDFAYVMKRLGRLTTSSVSEVS